MTKSIDLSAPSPLVERMEAEVNAVNRAFNAPRPLLTFQTKKGLKLESGVTVAPCAVIIDCHTGTCGENWTHQLVLSSGVDVEALAQEEANENASTYGNDGEEICDDCRENVNDCECESSSGSTWYENENIAGYIYKVQPSCSLDWVNGGSDWSMILEGAKDYEILTVHPETGAVCIYRSAMESYLHLPNHKEWNLLLEEVEHHFKTKMVVVV